MMEQISLGNRYKECRPRRTSSCQTKILVGKDVLNELEQRRSSPSVIAKLMGIEVLPPSSVVHSRPQEFKDVFEVSEEPPEAFTKERSHHFPKGLPSLKQRALRLKKLMPSKTVYRDDTHADCRVECTEGLPRLNSVEINNPLFENRSHDLNYSANYLHENDTSSVCETYPVGLANSSLSNFRLLSRGAKVKDFNSIVVLEPCLEKGHDAENIFSIPYLSPVNKNSRRAMKHKQSEFPVMENGRVRKNLIGTEDINVPRIRKERFLTSDSIDPHQIEQEASFHQLGHIDASCSGSSQRYSCGNDNFRQTNRPSSNSTLSKMRRHAETAVGSKTLAEMFALSDSERLKLNSDLHSSIQRNKTDHDDGHSKDGCFIVLPKHAPMLSIRSSMDRNYCLEGSSKGKNNPNTSNSYNNGKYQFDAFGDKARSLKQIGNGSEANLRNSCFQNLTADNFSTPDCANEKVLFTTDEDLKQQPPESEVSGLNLQFSRKKRVKRLPFHYHEYESISASDDTDGTKSCKGLKEVEQPSPVSILEPPTDEDSCFSGCFKYDLQEMTKKQSNGRQNHDEPEVSMSSDDEDHSSYQSLEAFQVEEDRDFSYLLDILICSGIIVADWQLICKSWYLPGCPVGPHVFDRLERKYSKIVTWAKPERRLLFDLVNSILSEVLAPCVDVHPWVQSSRYCVPLWGPEGPVEKVWQTIVRQREDCVTGHPVEMVLDANWLELGNDINMVGKQIARMLLADLLEEDIVDFLGELVVS